MKGLGWRVEDVGFGAEGAGVPSPAAGASLTRVDRLQGYLAHTKQRPPRTLQ